MNSQQARIRALLVRAYDSAALMSAIPVDLAISLASEGYDLRYLDRDIARINEEY